MKTQILIMLMVVSAMLYGCGGETPEEPEPTPPSEPGNEQTETTTEEAITEVDDSLLDEEEEIDLGDMI